MKMLIGCLSKGLAYFFYKMPFRVKCLFGDALGVLWFDIFRIRRQVILENIGRVFPDWTENQKKHLARESLKNMGKDLVEYSYLPFFSKIFVDQLYYFE